MAFSCLHAPFLCAAYGPGANYVAGCCGPPAILWSLGTLPTTLVRVCNTTTLNLQLSTLLFLNCLHKTPLFFDQPVTYCPARPPVPIHLLITHVLPHTPTRTFVFPLYSLIPHALTCPMELSTQVFILSPVPSFSKFSWWYLPVSLSVLHSLTSPPSSLHF